jgi:hypothetical protein
MTLRIRDTNIAEGQHSSDHRPAGGFPKISQIEEKYVACMIAIESDDILQGGGGYEAHKGHPWVPGVSQPWGSPISSTQSYRAPGGKGMALAPKM